MLEFRIDELLKEQNKSRYWLVKELHTSYPVIDNLADNTARAVRLDTLEKLMKAFDCEIGDLFKKKTQ
ncbi:MAG: helix-turn-helix transcriptional regulator [Ruminococcaceae bacterium]|nr:helix-turn-helix transcriptional regulator [Oscillospiraceae bacterium]